MFRTKKKKADGGASRKRKGFEGVDDEGDMPMDVAVAEPVKTEQSVDSEALPSVNKADDEPMGEEDEDDEQLALERMRSRMQKSKSKASSAMSFSSKTAVKKPKNPDEDMEATSMNRGRAGCLSFDEDTATGPKKKIKLRIRPNILSVDDHSEEDQDKPTNAYSGDMLASLLREQNVRLRPAAPEEDQQTVPAEGVSQEPEIMHPPSDEEMKGESGGEAEEFIPLNAKLMQEKKNKKRVTFGVQNQEFYPSKGAVVEEPIASSESEVDADEEDQSKRWEDELMRRGGGRQAQRAPSVPGSRGAKAMAPYPTRQKVPCASLGEVMRSIQRKLDTGRADQNRVSRELARLDVEVALIHQTLQKQRDEQLVCSEQFEYFQVVEDYVKGLAFCLREKLAEIEREEAKRSAQWLKMAEDVRVERERDIANEIQLCLQGSTVHARHFVGNVTAKPAAVAQPSDPSNQKVEHEARLNRFRRRDTDGSKIKMPHHDWDPFADVVEDMSSLSHVYGRFQEWKSKFPDVYKNAYCDLALSKLYAPYVRLELVDWDPLAGVHVLEAKRYRVPHMEWFKTLRLHCTQSHKAELEEPVISLLRDIVIARIVDAARQRFDPFSPTHTQKIIEFIEDTVVLGAVKLFEHPLDEVVTTVLGSLTDAAKRLPLLALNQQEAGVDRVRDFASFLVSHFCSLLENALTLFAVLPNGTMHQRGFNTVMQLLHQLLGYANHCKHLERTAMLSQASTTVSQLSSSSFMQSILSRSPREQFEFQHVLQLLHLSLTNPAT